jgi:predicted molibdopterin-dependent oxidoreductase YjgC
VEIEGNPKLLPACTTPIADGMVIHTHSEKAMAARRAVVELLLIRHPLKCFSCDSNGKCELQDVAYELGIESSPFTEEGDECRDFKLDNNNPFYQRDLNKCILCGRCIRVCHEKAQIHAIDFQNRGISTAVQPAHPLEDSDCVFCGQCVQVCPVGALSEISSKGRGRPWELSTVKTTCSYCGVGCALEIKVNQKTRKIANVVTNPGSNITQNKGRSCVKGRFAWQFIESPERMKKPLIRGENGTFREVSWEEAYKYIAGSMNKIKKDHGPDSLGFFSSARCTNEENYLFQKFARQVIGTNNIDHCAHL